MSGVIERKIEFERVLAIGADCASDLDLNPGLDLSPTPWPLPQER